MNDIIKQLKRRRSVKSFSDKMPSDDLLKEIAEAGSNAPSGMNRQPAIILVIKNKDLIDRIEKLNRQISGRSTNQFYNAPVLMVVLVDRSVSTRVYDGSLVMGNLLNAADACGLGACWIHRAKEVFDTNEGKDILKEIGVEGDYEGIGNCVIGYPSGKYPDVKPRKDKFIYYVD